MLTDPASARPLHFSAQQSGYSLLFEGCWVGFIAMNRIGSPFFCFLSAVLKVECAAVSPCRELYFGCGRAKRVLRQAFHAFPQSIPPSLFPRRRAVARQFLRRAWCIDGITACRSMGSTVAACRAVHTPCVANLLIDDPDCAIRQCPMTNGQQRTKYQIQRPKVHITLGHWPVSAFPSLSTVHYQLSIVSLPLYKT